MQGFIALALGLVLIATGVLTQDCTNNVADVVFVIDSSGSIKDKGDNNWRLVLEFVNQMVDRLNVGETQSRVGLVMFSTNAETVFYLRQYRSAQQVKDAVLQLEYRYMGGKTNTADGLNKMYQDVFTELNGDRPEYPNIGIVITDGESNENELQTLPAAAAARATGIYIFSIGVTDAVKESEVRGISSMPQALGQNYWLESGFDALNQIATTVARQTACVTTPRPPVTTPSTNPGCAAADIVFVLDSSGSIRDNNRPNGPDNWLTILEFVTSVIDLLNIGATATRVGLVQFSNFASNVFFLRDYIDKRTLREAVLILEEQYMGGTTNTSGAIRAAHLEHFRSENGDRPGVQNMIVLVTDGASNEDTERTVPDAVAAKEDGILILPVGVTDQINEEEIRAISSPPQRLGESYWTSTEFDDLQDVVEALASQTCRATEPPPVPTTNPDCHGEFVDLVFVVDSSGSIRDNNPPDGSYDNWILILEFIMSVVATLPIGLDSTRVGLVQYSNFATSRFYLNQFDSIVDVVDKIARMGDEYMGGTTNTSGGFRVLISDMLVPFRGNRPQVQDIAVIITDGESNEDQNRTIPDAVIARNLGVQIYSIGVTNKVNLQEVRGISSPPQELNVNYWLTEDFQKLDGLVNALSRVTCGAPTTPPTPAPSTTTVPTTTPTPAPTTTTQSPTTTSTSTTTPPTHPACFSREADLVFMVDDSASIKQGGGFSEIDNWDLVIRFLQSFAYQLVIDDNHFRVGMVRFSTGVTNEWYLSQGRDTRTVVSGCSTMKDRFSGGETNMAGALRTMREEQFTYFNGDRDRVPNIAVMLTDGRSNIDSQNTLAEARRAKDQDIRIFAIGVGNNVDQNELRSISSDPQQQDVNWFLARDFTRLSSLLTRIVAQVCAPPPPPPGPPGPPGPVGPRGPSGPPGQAGFPGPSGNPGFPGSPGQTGFPGPVGSTGPSGPAGIPGSDGRPGSTGPRGPVGPAGPNGIPGSQGANGKPGGIGATGTPGIGLRGPPGPAGRNGAAGATGLPGPVGPVGPTGFQGPVGPSGPTGPAGPRGFGGQDGRPGEAGSPGQGGPRGLPGGTGATGQAGSPGIAGRDGLQGRTGATGFPGSIGLVGGTGFTGDAGRPGPIGAPGPVGFTGSTGPVGAVGVAGPAGPRGPAGFPGPAGTPGRDGQPGATGTAGRPGSQGQPGARGENGPTGGTGAAGRQGPTGATGPAGPSGRSGAQGLSGQAGKTGATGSQGARGLAGATGRPGFPGAQGPTGPVGATGTAGLPGFAGLPGPTGGTGSTGRAGNPGLDGRPGEPGRPGAAGATGLPGVGIPGQAGQRGADGRPGTAGSPGQPGRAGGTGAPGLPGTRGLPGAAGVPGFAGSPGRSGALGPRGQPGAPGQAGAAGRNGVNGRTGATGQPGAPGRDGIPGRNGVNGRTGSRGQPGLQGIRGAPGALGQPGATGNPGQPGRDGQAGQRGEAGFPGSNGRTGATGQPGPSGLPGQPGQAGQRGGAGQAGANGRPGQTGATGQPGPTGATGRPGIAGTPGLKGQDGNPGPAGFPGTPGVNGRTGAAGAPGLRGSAGIAGLPGANGRPGRTGATGQPGQPGLRGEAGRNGEAGLAGSPGTPGRTGATGFPGPAGQPGLDGRPGSAGRAGLQGLPGSPGLAGSPGLPGSDGRVGAPGEKGSAGSAGSPGLAGSQGPPGPVGSRGLPGPAGSPGRAGSNGLPGRSGALGAAGSRGEPGFPGPPGNNGNPGSPGRNGPTGATGFAGPAGPTGATGARGLDGRSGAIGRPGISGRAGNPGRDGQPGRTGATGPAGRAGGIGLAGPAGPPGIGRTGATGLAGFDGRTGATGQAGRPGSPGSPGSPGRGGRTGATGQPGNAGPPGQGRAGPSGPPGSPGSAGPPGPIGNPGSLGPSGPPGPPGEAGSVGPAGPPGATVNLGCGQENECLERNGDCQHYCIDTFDSYYCACRAGYELVTSNYFCPGASCSNFKADIVFVLDSSGSIRDSGFGNWQLVLNFVNSVIEALTIGFDQTRVGLVYYSNDARVAFYLKDHTDKQSLKRAVNQVEQLYIGGTTNTSGGIRVMQYDVFTIFQGDRPEVENVCILITDGASNVDQQRTLSDAATARAQGIRIFSVGITRSINEQELRAISSEPQVLNQNYFTTAEFTTLNMVVDTLIKQTCSYSTNFFCRYSSEAKGNICFCRRGQCELEPTNGTFCSNINECGIDNGGCQHECQDTEGSYSCRCRQGFNLAGDSLCCEDVDECTTRVPCSGNEQCINTYGSYYCVRSAGVAALVDTAEGKENPVNGQVSMSGLAMASALSACVAVLVSVVVVLVIRQVRSWRASRSADKRWGSNGVSNRAFNDSHSQGFSTMRSKFAFPAGAYDDAISSLSTSSTIS